MVQRRHLSNLIRYARLTVILPTGQIVQRIHPCIVLHDAEVQMGAGGVAGAAGIADDLSLRHGVARFDVIPAEMAVQGRVAFSVIDNNALAIAALPAGPSNGTVLGRQNGGAHRCSDIHTLVVGTADTAGGLPSAEQRGDPSDAVAGPCIAAYRADNVIQAQFPGLFLCGGDQAVQRLLLSLDGVILRLLVFEIFLRAVKSFNRRLNEYENTYAEDYKNKNNNR